MEFVRRHRLTGVLEYAVERDALPDAWRDVLRAEPFDDAWGALAARTVAIHGEAARVHDLLAREGIRAFLLKGCYTGRMCYPRLTMRPMQDVDVLIAAGEIRHAADTLARAGYVPVPGQELHGPSKDIHEPQLMHPDRGIEVELHHCLTPGGMTVETLDELPGGAAAPHDGAELAPHVHLAHKLLDIAKDGHARVGLLHYLDLVRLRRTFADELREAAAWQLLARGGSAGRAASTWRQLQRLCAEGGAPFPLDAHAAPPCPWPALAVAAWAARSDGLWRLRYTPRWQRRVIAAVLRGVR